MLQNYDNLSYNIDEKVLVRRRLFMDDKLRFKMVIIGMISVLGIMLSGHFKFLSGLLISFLPFIWIILKYHKTEYQNIKTNNKYIKILLIARILVNFIALIVCFLFVLDMFYEISTVTNKLPLILGTITTLSLFLDSILKKYINRDFEKKGEKYE